MLFCFCCTFPPSPPSSLLLSFPLLSPETDGQRSVCVLGFVVALRKEGPDSANVWFINFAGNTGCPFGYGALAEIEALVSRIFLNQFYLVLENEKTEASQERSSVT